MTSRIGIERGGQDLQQRSDPTASLPRLAYLTNWYPAVSLTFVLREIEALREIGAEVLPCSIRRSPPEQHPGEAERAEAARTFNVLQAVQQPMILLAALGFALGRPGLLGQTLALAWTSRRPGLRGLIWQMAYLIEALVLARHLHHSRAGHLHIHFISGVATAGMLAAALADIPFSLMVHGPTDFEDPRGWRLDLKVRRSAFVATISHFARSQIMIHADPEDWDKIHIIHCGVLPELYHSAPRGPSGETELVFVGRLAPVKGLRVLLEALQRVKAPVHLTIVGDGPDRRALETAAAALSDRVEFTGYLSQKEVAQRLATRADIVVLPSFAEGVPVILMEAMATGLPVIATSVAGTGELVESGVSGLLVPPGDVEALAQAIDRLAADPGLRGNLGAAGLAKVQKEFDIRHEARRLARLMAGDAMGEIRPDLPGETDLPDHSASGAGTGAQV